MILWTIQTPEAWRILQETGILRADATKVDPDWLPAYFWMAEQMKRQIGPAPDGVVVPVWAWKQWADERRPKPDLRVRGHVPQGEWAVRIEFEIPQQDALLSDFELWHYVLNEWYLPSGRRDALRFETDVARGSQKCRKLDQSRQHPRIQHQIRSSWSRIFDFARRNSYVGARAGMDRAIQATLWELRVEMVRDVTVFRGR